MDRLEARDKSRLSHWFPAVEFVVPAGMYPATTIVELKSVTYGGELLCEPEYGPELESAADEVLAARVLPFFLRGDLQSGKHVYPESVGICRTRDDVLRCMAGIAEYAACSIWFGDKGLDTWAVREVLIPANAPRTMNGIPIGHEWRMIVRDGAVTEESGFYWPSEALVQNTQYKADAWTQEDAEAYIGERTNMGYPLHLTSLSINVARALGGDWSVDWMLTDSGWKLIDMAVAADSWIPHPRESAAK